MIDIGSLIKPASSSSNWLKLLVYGEYGCGKTTFAAGAPKPLIVNHERGVTSLLKNPELRSTPTLEIKSLAEYMQLFEYLRSPAGAAYDTVIIDTMSELQKIFLDSIIREEGKTVDSYAVPNGGFLKNTQQLRALLANLLSLEKHLIVLCHVNSVVVENIMVKSPQLTPKVAEGFMGLMDVVGFMSVLTDPVSKEVTRTIQTLATPRVQAKNRLDVPDLMQNPKVSDFLAAFEHLQQIPNQIQLKI
jgi:hypothetical protein